MANLSGGQIVVKVLEREGVEKAFCVPGESYLGVIDALYQHPVIDLVSARHEGGASFMAEGYAKASGHVGVCMATRGPGAANLSIGLHTAMQDSTPLVALIGQVERPFKEKEAFQEVDFTAYFSHLCKWTVEIDTVERIPELLHRAFYTARSGRPGPVVVSLPHDMLADRMNDFDSSPVNDYQPDPSESSIIKVLDKLESAAQPVIIAGGGVIAAHAEDELARFAERMQVPVVTAFRRFHAICNDHPNYAGWLGFGSDPYLLDYIKKADIILTIGTRLSQVTTQDYNLISDEAELIQVDLSPESIGKACPAHIGIISDARAFLNKSLHLAKPFWKKRRSQQVTECRKKYHAFSKVPKRNKKSSCVDLNGVIADFIDELPNDSIVTSDAGNFFGWVAKYVRFTKRKTYIGPTSGAMGYGFPAALGAKSACPDKTVVSFSGDGGFMMTIQEMETAVRNRLAVIAIVVNNRMYGTIRAHQERQFPARVIGTSLTNPDFAEAAKLFGCEGERVKRTDDFLPAFKRALNSDLPYVIELVTDPNILSVGQTAK